MPPKQRWPALTDLDQVRALLRASDLAGAMPATRCASRFLAPTAQRPGMVRNAARSQFGSIDRDNPEAELSEAVRRIPADRMKEEF